MFSHVTVGSSNIAVSSRFYDDLLAPLGLHQRTVEPDGGPGARCWVTLGQELPRFYIYQPYDGRPACAGNGVMVAFQAASRNAVDTAYKAGLKAGGTDAGEPGPRPHYGADYYGAYLYDPDGNKVHIVFRGDLK